MQDWSNGQDVHGRTACESAVREKKVSPQGGQTPFYPAGAPARAWRWRRAGRDICAWQAAQGKGESW